MHEVCIEYNCSHVHTSILLVLRLRGIGKLYANFKVTCDLLDLVAFLTHDGAVVPLRDGTLECDLRETAAMLVLIMLIK